MFLEIKYKVIKYKFHQKSKMKLKLLLCFMKCILIILGVHTEKLKAGNFNSLELLDFGFNIVDNQHNLICVRNFRHL